MKIIGISTTTNEDKSSSRYLLKHTLSSLEQDGHDTKFIDANKLHIVKTFLAMLQERNHVLIQTLESIAAGHIKILMIIQKNLEEKMRWARYMTELKSQI